jgi:hypothetical protein
MSWNVKPSDEEQKHQMDLKELKTAELIETAEFFF